jgi:hypothetical protein
VNAWGDPKLLPYAIHGCFVDNENNIWIGGSSDGVVQKWTHDGKTMLLQIGRKGVCDNLDNKSGEPGGNKSPTLLNDPAYIAVNAGNVDVYIADSYGNHRVVVFDANGAFLRQWGDAGTDRGLFALMGAPASREAIGITQRSKAMSGLTEVDHSRVLRIAERLIAKRETMRYRNPRPVD